MKNKPVAAFLILAASLCVPSMTYAATSGVQPNGIAGGTYWNITGVGAPYTAQSGWNSGPSGTGPSTLTFYQTIGVSNGVSGQVTVSDSDVSAAVGFNVTYSYLAEASYSIAVPAGHKYRIL